MEGQKERARIYIRPYEKLVEISKGSTLLDVLRKAEISIEAICGGKGECGKCKVIGDKGQLLREESVHKKHLSAEEISSGYCLACQTIVLSDAEISIPIESRRIKPKILTHAKEVSLKIQPAVRKYTLDVFPYFTKRDLVGGLKRKYNLDINESSLDDNLYRKIAGFEGKITATVSESKGKEIIKLEPGDTTNSNYGLAIDVGTTTIVAKLIDLNTGKSLGQESAMNRQIAFGEDLISRIGYALNIEGLKRLQSEVVKSINELIQKLSKSTQINGSDINDICVGGNTVMNHLLAGIDVGYLNFADAKVSREPILMKASTVGMNVNPSAWIYCLPNVSRFLGGDAIGDVLTSGMHLSSDISLLVDLGTNGEIILGNSDWLFSCSVPSGPAWEGGGIKFGMRAMEGAIESISIDPTNFKAEYAVIGDTKPRGLCGSGIIDLLAELYSVGLLDFSGKLIEGKSDMIRSGNDGLEYVVVQAGETAIEKI